MTTEKYTAKITPHVTYESTHVTFDNQEVHLLILGALQYAFGRKTYVPSSTQSLIKKYWDILPDNTKERILYFTKSEINMNDKLAEIDYKQSKSYYLGDEADVQGWKEFYQYILSKHKDNATTQR